MWEFKTMIEFLYLLARYLLMLGVSVTVLYSASKLMDKLTTEIDEWREIAKGNIAVSIYYASVILSFGIIINAGMGNYLAPAGVSDPYVFALALLGDILRAIISMVSAVITIYLALTFYDKLTHDIEEFEELKNGNIAMGVIVGGVLLAISLLIAPAVKSLSQYIFLALFG